MSWCYFDVKLHWLKFIFRQQNIVMKIPFVQRFFWMIVCVTWAIYARQLYLSRCLWNVPNSGQIWINLHSEWQSSKSVHQSVLILSLILFFYGNCFQVETYFRQAPDCARFTKLNPERKHRFLNNSSIWKDRKAADKPTYSIPWKNIT